MKSNGNKTTLKSGNKPRSFSLFSAFTNIICAAVLLFALSVLALETMFPMSYSAQVESSAKEFGLDRAEVYAVIKAESGFDPNAVSRAGATGLMQLMPSTADFCAALVGEELGENEIFDPATNIRLGCCYLNYLKARFEGDYVYAAYNAGEGRVRLWMSEGREKAPVKETADYVKRVGLYKKIYSLLYDI